MTKVYPNAVIPTLVAPERHRFLPESSTAGRSPVVLTVWKKSLLFNCDGFTVYDTKGNLVFRVDNYANSNKSEIVLMDSSGHSLITIRRKDDDTCQDTSQSTAREHSKKMMITAGCGTQAVKSCRR
ncbi:LURP-one-related 8-like protein [Tanacetum coccineum]